MEKSRPSMSMEAKSFAKEVAILVPYIMAVELVMTATLNTLGTRIDLPVIAGVSTAVGSGIRQIVRK